MAFPIIGVVTGLLGAAGDFIKGWSERKTMKQQHKLNMEAAKQKHDIDLAERGQFADIEADKSIIDQMSLTWKDEYLTIVFTVPAVMVFIPGLAQYVQAGFIALRETPQWYQVMLILVAASGLGLRKFVDGLINKLFVY